MKLTKQFPLQNKNSFNVKTTCSTIYFLEKLVELMQLPDFSEQDFYILGDGSNTLFVDEQAPIIIKPNFKGIEIVETDDSYNMTVAAGENWHDLVYLCIEQGINGLENLALIPGSVGAAPVQNIGAYGVEFSDFCVAVKWFEFSSKSIKTMNKSDCHFSYRNSIFKQGLYNKGVITEVVLNFPKEWQPNLSYAGLDDFDETPSAKQVMDQVITLRKAKLPDPEKIPNAGSFFKNPIVSLSKLNTLKNTYSKIPYYPQKNGQVKIAAGWLIERAGLKGYCKNGVGVHEHQALVLVNHSSLCGKDIVDLAQYVQQQVFTKFNILLSPEVRMVTAEGEQEFADLPIRFEGK